MVRSGRYVLQRVDSSSRIRGSETNCYKIMKGTGIEVSWSSPKELFLTTCRGDVQLLRNDN